MKKIKNNKLQVSKSTFYPVQDLETKNNFKRYYRIDRDGTVKERIFLNVPSLSLREQIICLHYLSFYVRHFVDTQNPVGVNFTSRDNPWDFGIQLNNGESFNVEITSIADNTWLHEKMKREEAYDRAVYQEKISVRQLEKFYKWFDDKKIKKFLDEIKSKELDKESLIKNPVFNDGPRMYISDSKEEEMSLSKLIMKAVDRKLAKNHRDKENTIIIIDNRTSLFETKDYREAMDKIGDKIINVPFPAIYLYTGYYSDNDGHNAEYSFSPIKQSKNKWQKIQENIERDRVAYDEDKGVFYH